MRETCDPRVIDVDGYVHLVGGKVICFKSEDMDLTSQTAVNDLLGFAEDLYKDSSVKPVYGKYSVCILHKRGDHEWTASQCDFRDMPKDIQASIRKVSEGYGE